MSTITATQTPEEIIASEPERKRGLKTPFNKEGDRKITFSWEIGTGVEFDEPVKVTARLEVTHRKASDSRDRRARYQATLYRITKREGGLESIKFDGRNGTRVVDQTQGAGRFNADTLSAFANYALNIARGEIANAKVRVYFTPEGW